MVSAPAKRPVVDIDDEFESTDCKVARPSRFAAVVAAMERVVKPAHDAIKPCDLVIPELPQRPFADVMVELEAPACSKPPSPPNASAGNVRSSEVSQEHERKFQFRVPCAVMNLDLCSDEETDNAEGCESQAKTKDDAEECVIDESASVGGVRVVLDRAMQLHVQEVFHDEANQEVQKEEVVSDESDAKVENQEVVSDESDAKVENQEIVSDESDAKIEQEILSDESDAKETASEENVEVTGVSLRDDVDVVSMSSTEMSKPVETAPARKDSKIKSAATNWVHPVGADEDEHQTAETGEAHDDDEADARVALFRRSRIIKIGLDHPDALCEPRAVRDTEPEPLTADDDIWIPMSIVSEGVLSSPQIESVALAARRFRRRLPDGSKCGFLLGDGTGCGKGRCISALVLDQWNRGARRHLWVSATSDLLADAMRDLSDLKTGIPVCSLSKVKVYGALDDNKGHAEIRKLGPGCDGVLFATYSLLVAGVGGRGRDSSDPRKSRFGQVLAWLKGRKATGDGLICLDEAHKAKNLDLNTMCARRIEDLQVSCPGCGVLYASATGATEVRHMSYMMRLGLWGLTDQEGKQTDSTDIDEDDGADGVVDVACFPNFTSFRSVVEKGGMAAMELVAIQLRMMGALSCRSLAFSGTSFELVNVPLSAKQRQQYDLSVEFFRDVKQLIEVLKEHGCIKEENGRSCTHSQFWSTQQRFFKGLVLSAKVDKAVEETQESLKRGQAVVMSLWTTNESVMNRQRPSGNENDIEGLCDGFLSGPELMLEHFLHTQIEPILPMTNGVPQGWAASSLAALRKRVVDLDLPPNPLDSLIDKLGGPEAVAEMSGRSLRRIRNSRTGVVEVERRQSSLKSSQGAACVDSVNIAENRAFQRGEKLVAIITEAASAGISLHSDRREGRPGEPPRPRRMLCLELPWAADKAVQQLGRVHRSNQLHPPAFACIVTDLGGEARFVSAVTQRLRQLGAMTRGDRHSALGQDDAFGFGSLDVVSGPYGSKALCKLLVDIVRQDTDVGGKPAVKAGWNSWKELASLSYQELDKQELRMDERDALKKDGVKRFLNRLLGCTCGVQRGLFAALAAHVSSLEEVDRREGTLDEGVVTLNRNGRWGKVRSIEEAGTEPVGDGSTGLVLRKLRLDRGTPWSVALQLLEAAPADPELGQGFFIRGLERGVVESVLVLRRWGRPGVPCYTLHYPNLGPSHALDGLLCTLVRIKGSNLNRCDDRVQVEREWVRQYTMSATQCVHLQRRQACKDSSLCSVGVRCAEETMLTGPLLAHWDTIKNTQGVRTTLVRASVGADRTLVGMLIPPQSVELLRERLQPMKVSYPDARPAFSRAGSRHLRSGVSDGDEPVSLDDDSWSDAPRESASFAPHGISQFSVQAAAWLSQQDAARKRKRETVVLEPVVLSDDEPIQAKRLASLEIGRSVPHRFTASTASNAGNENNAPHTSNAINASASSANAASIATTTDIAHSPKHVPSSVPEGKTNSRLAMLRARVLAREQQRVASSEKPQEATDRGNHMRKERGP